MIDYAVLCRAIDDWKAGHAPRSAPPARPPARPSRPPKPAAAAPPAPAPAPEIAEQQAPEDRTIIYQLPDIEDGDEIG